jgi:hypothetical protein
MFIIRSYTLHTHDAMDMSLIKGKVVPVLN